MAGISHLIYPTFPSIFKASNGEIIIRQFETKDQIYRQIQSCSIPSTILCPGPFYTDFNKSIFAYWEADNKLVLSTPAEGSKRMSWADPGHDIGWFARAAFDKGPEWMKGQQVPVCGQSISYSELATQLSAVTGIKAVYRQCSIEEFEKRLGAYKEVDVDQEDMMALGKWLTIAPDDKACYGTIEMDRLRAMENDLGVKALSWEQFLERTYWRGPIQKEHPIFI
jgi:hypothetical protein